MAGARMLAIAVLGGLALATPATAQVRELAPRGEVVGGPVLGDGRVLYAEASATGVRLLARPAGGGPATAVTTVPVRPARSRVPPGWELAAGAGLALRVTPSGGPSRLYAGDGSGPLALVTGDLRPGPLMADERQLHAAAGGPLVLERIDGRGLRLRAVLRPPGAPARVLALPRGADTRAFAAAGPVAAVAVPGQERIALLDLPSGTVRAWVGLGPLARTEVIDLAVSPAGDVALTVEDGQGVDALGWAPAGAAEVRLLRTGDRFGLVRTGGGRIAMAEPVLAGDGARPVVLDPSGAEPRTLFRGPPAAYVRTLDLDGAHVAWSVDGCQYVARADGGERAARPPAGRCVRTQAAFSITNDLTPGGSPPGVPVGVRCVTAPGRSCRVDLRLYGATRLGRRVARVAVGREASIRVPVPAAAARRAARARQPLLLIGWVVDPDGRRRRAVMF